MDLHILCTKLGVSTAYLNEHQTDDWIGIDYGALMLVKAGIRPIAAFGDFDSVSADERMLIESVIDIEYLPAEKNETDLEVGVQYAKSLGYDKVYIHGATGGRLDHFLGNLQTLIHPDILLSESDFIIVDDYNEIQVLPTGTHVIEKSQNKKYVSFIPVNDGVILTIDGLKYETERLEVNMGYTRTVSNEFVTDRAEITVEQGMVYMIQSKEAK
ncbi:thiamine diphosphokinase [Macrococcoides caseolyticum]|uniref:thiamine diphosphokinase n=1 Tax=Macrococcoides caseolyticum TaxID=69966 RepID=UPI001F431B7E|nr:thiamine diphosphokinase [Macrococcus caseolyticus]MCE4956788.1 thiamine diphosphokinase [Macrococcus caseolyticus]